MSGWDIPEECVGEHGDQPLARGVDDAAAGDAAGVASKSHAHGQALLAAGVRALEGVVELESDPGQVARVLEQGEQREKDGHRRQHDGYDGRQHAPQTVREQRDGKRRQAERGQRGGERFCQAEQVLAQPRARHICAG